MVFNLADINAVRSVKPMLAFPFAYGSCGMFLDDIFLDDIFNCSFVVVFDLVLRCLTSY